MFRMIRVVSFVGCIAIWPAVGAAQGEAEAPPTTEITAFKASEEAPAVAVESSTSAEHSPAETTETPPEGQAANVVQESADDYDMTGFYKGELGSPGAPTLDPPNDAVFVGLGYYNLGGVLGQHYLRLEPAVHLHFNILDDKQLILRFAGPLNVLLYDGSKENKKSAGSVRAEDYDEASDYLKLIKLIQVGRKEDRLFLKVGLLYGVNIGHGAVVRRYNTNLDPDRTRLGIQFDAYNDYAGFESFIADVAMQSQVMGGLAFVKPLSLVSDSGLAKSFSVGAHYTADLNAPKRLNRDVEGNVVTDKAGNPVFKGTTVGIWGVDSEIKPIRLGNALDLKLYADFSQIVDAGTGFTGGVLLRSSFGERPIVNAFRVRLEGRRFDNNYVPQYFDSFYEVSKFMMVRGEATGTEPTKVEGIVAAAASGPKKSSFYAEASYAFVDQLVVGVGLERLLGSGGYYNLLVHVEVPAFEFLRLYASYQKLGYTDLGKSFELADSGRSFKADTIFQAQARMMILPILFVSAGLNQSYQFISPNTRDDPGRDWPGGYKPKLDLLVAVQLGWEFSG